MAIIEKLPHAVAVEAIAALVNPPAELAVYNSSGGLV